MKILFLSHYYPPESNAPANRTYEHIREWVRSGDEVTVITNQPNHPTGTLYHGYRNLYHSEEMIDGIKVLRVWTYLTPNKGVFRRTLNYATYMIMAVLKSLFLEKPDVIITTSPQFLTVIAGYLVSIIRGKPFIFELRDIWPESIKSVGAMENNIFLSILERLELFLYRRAHLIISVTDSFVKNLTERGIDRNKIEVVKNGVDLEFFHPISDEEKGKLKDELGYSGKFLVSYIGTIGMAHAVNKIVDTARLLESNKSIHILIIGDGAEKENVTAQVKSLCIENVSVLGQKPKDEIPAYYAISDAIIVSLKKDPVFTRVIPSKIFEIMGMGQPILISVDGEARKIVDDAQCGLYSEPEDIVQLMENIILLQSDSQKRQNLGISGFSYVKKHYDRKKLARRMREIVLKSIETQHTTE